MNNQQQKIIEMFDRVAPSYDLLNHLLSFGIDYSWRKTTVRKLENAGSVLLDLCGGTGDMAISFKNNGIKIICDLSTPLLSIAQKKCRNKRDFFFLKADAHQLPLTNNSTDAITIAFGLRNIINMQQALLECHRVLKKNGSLAILEFSLPKNSAIRFFYTFYLRYIVPTVGGLISGDRSAYAYLQESIEGFPRYEELVAILQQCNFVDARYHMLSFGIATLYLGKK